MAAHTFAPRLLSLLLVAAAPLAAQKAPAAEPFQLGGLSHLPSTAIAADAFREGCTIVRASSEKAPEERRDCAAPRPPFRGQVFEWLESAAAISLYPAILTTGAPEPPPLLFGARGTVRVAAADPAVWVDFLQLDSFRATRSPRPDFRRRVTAAEAAQGVALPAGQVLAIASSKRGTWLTRPARLEAGAQLELVPEAPAAGRSDLLLVLRRPRPLALYDRDHELLPRLRRGAGEPRQPDLLVASGDRILALFYDLPAGNFRLEAESAAYRLEPRDLELRGGEASVVAFDLTPLPNLVVRLEMPAGLRNGPLVIEAVELASGEKLTEMSGVDPRSQEVDLGFLPPVEVEVRLLVESWYFTQEVDLRPQEDVAILFAPKPIAVSGVVSRDGRPFETSLVFSSGGPDRPEPVYTDAGGRYETLLYKPGFFPVIFEVAAEQPAFIREIVVPDAPSATFDFDIPGNEVRVVVVDAETQEAVPSPRIYLELQRDGATQDKGPLKMQFAAGEDGSLALPPLAPGPLVVAASAEGYLRSPPMAFDVIQLGKQHEIRILLEKGVDPKILGFLRPDGEPAAGLEIRAQGGLDDSLPSFEGFTNASGEIEIPAQIDGLYLLWRDPSGRLASGYQSYLAENAGDNEKIVLSFRAPLVLRVTDRSGLPAANVALLVWGPTGELLEGETLQFLYEAKTTDAHGFFRVRGATAQTFTVLAYDRASKHSSFDPLASQITWPWPAIVPLEKVD